MDQILITINEARVILELHDAHVRNLFREDYDQLMDVPIREALAELNQEDTAESRERIINLASIYFELLKIN